MNIGGLGKALGKTEANFILIQVMKFYEPSEVDSSRAKRIYQYMAEDSQHGCTPIVVRYRGDELGCEGCLRITVGTELECYELLQKIAKALDLVR